MREIISFREYGKGVIGPSAKDQILSNLSHGRELLSLTQRLSFFETVSNLAKSKARAAALAVPLIIAACGEQVKVDGNPPSPTVTPAETSPAASPAATTAAPVRTEVPTAAQVLSKEEEQKAGDEAHLRRLVKLDPEFRQKGYLAWLVKAGFSFDGLQVRKEARQIEEETLNVDGQTRILASGVQVDVENLSAPWPNALTISDPSVKAKARACIQPDVNNPSLLCTDVKGFTGKATLYVDAQNWTSLAPAK